MIDLLLNGLEAMSFLSPQSLTQSHPHARRRILLTDPASRNLAYPWIAIADRRSLVQKRSLPSQLTGM